MTELRAKQSIEGQARAADWCPMQPSDRVTAELKSGLAPKRPSGKASGGRSLVAGRAIQLVALHLLVQGMSETVAFITSGPCRG